MPSSMLHSPDAPLPIGPYAQATTAGGFIFTSGQLGVDPQTGALVSGGVEAQAARALENLRQVLGAGGADFSDVVATVIYLTDLSHFKAINELYERAMDGSKPARTTVQVAALPLGAGVEIAMTAFRGD
jgi:2-iminobutanoate/2-iminopropanoate deaminase